MGRCVGAESGVGDTLGGAEGHRGGEVTGLLWSGDGRRGRRASAVWASWQLKLFQTQIMSLPHRHLSAPLPAWNAILTHHWSQHVARSGGAPPHPHIANLISSNTLNFVYVLLLLPQLPSSAF